MAGLDWEALPSIALALLLGASVGSFLNVVVYRLPAGQSLLYPPSRCPRCGHRLAARDNLPVVGWLSLGGRCRYCRAPISPRYPLVEAATAGIFLAVLARYGLSWQTLGYWIFLAWLLALALIDWDTLRLPNALTRSGLSLGLLFQTAIGAQTGGLAGAAAGLLASLLGMTLGLWVLEAIALLGSLALGRTAMGAGDAKLAALLGAWLGGPLVLLAGFVACWLGAIAGLGGRALGKLERSQPIPFGPFLALGGAIALFAGQEILAAYTARWL